MSVLRIGFTSHQLFCYSAITSNIEHDCRKLSIALNSVQLNIVFRYVSPLHQLTFTALA